MGISKYVCAVRVRRLVCCCAYDEEYPEHEASGLTAELLIVERTGQNDCSDLKLLLHSPNSWTYCKNPFGISCFDVGLDQKCRFLAIFHALYRVPMLNASEQSVECGKTNQCNKPNLNELGAHPARRAGARAGDRAQGVGGGTSAPQTRAAWTQIEKPACSLEPPTEVRRERGKRKVDSTLPHKNMSKANAL